MQILLKHWYMGNKLIGIRVQYEFQVITYHPTLKSFFFFFFFFFSKALIKSRVTATYKYPHAYARFRDADCTINSKYQEQALTGEA
jgi:hypothetical protein